MLPLDGVKVLELGGMGPVPFAGMMLADSGATGLRILRPGGVADEGDFLARNRPFLELDLKAATGRADALALARAADILLEGFRPGVLEGLGLAPETLHAENPRLVICRVTGWGQAGPMAQVAGHDLNFVSLSGALHLMGPADGPPLPPLNLVGDFGGGLMAAYAALAGLLAARATGKGQVIDCAMADAAGAMMTWIFGERAAGRWSDRRGTNQTDGSAPFYRTYETSDGGYIAVAAIEERFFGNLANAIGLGDWRAALHDPAEWPELGHRMEAIFRTRSVAEWTSLLETGDTCSTPVLAPGDAPGHPHNHVRQAFDIDDAGHAVPAPAPRFAQGRATSRPAWPAEEADLAAWRRDPA